MTQCTPTTRTPIPDSCFGPVLSGGVGAEPPLAEGPFLLDPLQTSSHHPVAVQDSTYPQYDVNPDFIPFEHRGWHNIRMKIRDAMESTDQPAARANKFLSCGDDVYVYEEQATGEIDYHGSRCGDRFCLVCGQLRSRRIARSLEPRLKAEQPLFITLTVRGKPGDRLSDLINRLTDGWKELRRLKHWRERISGGAIMLEVKYSTTSGGHWHPHYHLLCTGKFIEKQWLSDAWKVITRDSDQVDIQRVADLDKALGYVVKYASKPMDPSFTMRPHLLCEAMTTLKGKRLCACFGTWYGTPLNEKLEDDADGTEVLTNWSYQGTCRDIACRAERGDRHARQLLQEVERLRALRYALDLRCRSAPKMHATTGPPCITAA